MGDTVTTTTGTLIFAKSGQGHFSYICNRALIATAIFKGNRQHGTFYGVLQFAGWQLSIRKHQR
jgi:hypothetical protein